MAINKVIVDGSTVLDLTGTTVTASDLPNGKTALDHTGTLLTGSTPRIHSSEGTFILSNGQSLYYRVMDDVVNIYGEIGGASRTIPTDLSGTIPADIRPDRIVESLAKVINTSKDILDRVFVLLSPGGSLTVQGLLPDDNYLKINVMYLLGAL